MGIKIDFDLGIYWSYDNVIIMKSLPPRAAAAEDPISPPHPSRRMSVLILDSKRLDQHLTTEDGSFDEKCWKSLMVNSTEDLVAIV